MGSGNKLSLEWDCTPNTCKPIFFVRRADRLLARIKHLLYALRFAKKAKGSVAMIWPDQPARVQVYDGPNYHPGLIIDLDALRSSGQSQDLFFLPGSTPWSESGPSLRDSDYAENRNNKFKADIFEKPNLRFFDDALINYRFIDEPSSREWLDNEIRNIFQDIPLTKQVTEKVSEIKDRLKGSDYLSVHFRAGDVYGMLQEANLALKNGTISDARLTLLLGHLVARTSPLEFFEEHISQAIDEGKTILFSSDSPQAIASFEERFGRGRFVDLAAVTAAEPIQKAMIDFCAIGGGKKVLGSRGNYGAMAALVGGAEMVIVSAAASTTKNTAEAIELYQRLAHELLSIEGDLSSPFIDQVNNEILRRFIYVNRLADPETIKSLDPRPAKGKIR